ncbi:MAG: hypothetical protein ABI358_10390 [Ginsengibacter sp.]
MKTKINTRFPTKPYPTFQIDATMITHCVPDEKRVNSPSNEKQKKSKEI